MENVRNIGIFAHVDAGKTTLTERILIHCGAIRQAGSVDEGTAHTDRLTIERQRGISVKATYVDMRYKGVKINLIDTPGHTDFAAEVERSLWALDGAVLLMSAVEGVQPQTEVLFEHLKAQHIPTIFFINKMDREGADPIRVIARAKESLSPKMVRVDDDDQLMEFLCEEDDRTLTDWMSDIKYSHSELIRRLGEKVRGCSAYPVLTGSALRDTGVVELLDMVSALLPAPNGNPEDSLCGVVFAVDQDKMMGRAAHVRLFSGTVRNRDAIELPTGDNNFLASSNKVQRKITQIRNIDLKGRSIDLGVLKAGEIGAVYGLGDITVGEVLGDPAQLPRRIELGQMRVPLMMVQVLPSHQDQLTRLRQALKELCSEDPLLNAQWSEHSRQLHIYVMGAIQLEVMTEQLKSRYTLDVTFSQPSVIYRETISKPSVGFVAYTMPKPCWAVLKFQIEPAPRGSGVTFESVVPVREIMQRYQNQVEQALPLALKQGVLGWQVTDVKITLIGGEHHLVHTHPLDFIVATPMGIMDGLRRGGSTLLEPVLSVRFSVPERCGGRLMSDVVAMRGVVVESQRREDWLYVTAELPVATSLNYTTELAVISGGWGSMSVKFKGYQDCALELGATALRRSVDPLDTSKYILAARSALEGGIFDL